ncbi:MAG TPA: response regulator [Hyphomonadaceae bacterium]|nr:response regulator [Hyphomonadaceae bacterium]HPN04266.1 response regulator [Hyphomonadaceae bacterium]
MTATALILENDRYMRRLMCNLLKERGIGSTPTQTVDEALRAAEGQQFDVALVDIGLDEGSGLDLVRHLRSDTTSRNRAVPILIVSGNNHRGAILESRDCGVDAYLVKPLSASALMAKVDHVMTHRRAIVSSPGYFGPDRRRERADPYSGPERRSVAYYL